MNTHTDAGDDAEDPLGADQQLTQVRPRRGFRCPSDVEDARRRHRAQAADHVVEAAIASRVLAGGPGRGETADRRELEALREMPQREAAFAEQAFGLRTRDPRAELGLSGHLVEGMQFVEPAQVEGDHGVELTSQRIETADDAGSTTERDDGDAALPAQSQNRGDLLVVAGQQHRVGCVLHSGVPASQQVKGGLAAGAEQPIPVVDAAVVSADDVGQCVAVGV